MNQRTRGIVSGLTFLSAVGCASADAAPARTPAPSTARPSDPALARGILKELIEINTTHANGATAAARAVAARLLAAGFAPADAQVLVPDGHPTKGNVVARLHGGGKAAPILYICHLDVVEARREDWTYDPFTLTEKDGWFYGRGTIDMKGQDAAVLASLLRLKREGYVPDRDIIVAFTDDEEAGSNVNGVKWLLQAHKDLVDASLVINPDGGEAALKTGRKLYVGLQTSEKVFLTFQAEVTDKGGHSSRPTPGNPIYRLSKDLAKLADYRFPLHLTETTRLYFARRALMETGATKADMLAISKATPDPGAEARLSTSIETDVLLRTTCVATMIEGGHAENALPQRARATIQCRVIPGETPESVQSALTTAMSDPSLVLTTMTPASPSPESIPTPRILGAVEQVVKQMWPGVTVLPQMMAGASDGVFTRGAGIPTYGVDAMFDDLDDGRAHGKDERIGVAVFDEDVEFTYRLMKVLTTE